MTDAAQIKGLVERLTIHAANKDNTAFARSTMRECMEVLAALAPAQTSKAWLWTLHMEFDQKTERLTLDEVSPFPDGSYSPIYPLTKEPLYAAHSPTKEQTPASSATSKDTEN